MSMKAIEKLMLHIGINDGASKGVASITKSLDTMKSRASDGVNSIKSGAVGLLATGVALMGFMQPVYAMQNALNDVRAFDVHEKAIAKLEAQSIQFSTRYGVAAVDVAKSSAGIASSFDNLSTSELLKLTETSNLLAKATKTDVNATTDYLSRMYNHFQTTADEVGRAKWLSQLADQTAQATKLFRTSGADMKSAFDAIGARGANAGIALEEQLAILGMTQSIMGGSQAGGAYKQFLEDIGKAQTTLGMRFMDSNGKMLPMLNIIEKLKARYGDTLNVLENNQLQNAFGKEAALMLTNLMKRSDAFGSSLNELKKNKGMGSAAKMAEKMADPWERFTAQVTAVRIGIGNSLLPVVNDFLGVMGSGLNTIVGWTKEFPNITKVIGLTVLAMLALSAVVSAGSMFIGFFKLALVAWNAVALVAKTIMFALSIAAGLLSAPIWLIVLVFIALGAALSALVYYFDDILAFFSDVNWSSIGQEMMAGVTQIGKSLVWAFTYVPRLIGEVIGSIGEFFGVWDFLKNSLGSIEWLQPLFKALGWLGDKIKSLMKWAGMDAVFDLSTSEPTLNSTSKDAIEASTSIKNTVTADRSLPSAADSLNRTGQGTSIETLNINTQNPLRPKDLESYLILQGG